MSMPGVRSRLPQEQQQRLQRRGLQPTTHERASLYLHMVDVLKKSTRPADAQEAKKVS
jgi:hypothetical protein